MTVVQDPPGRALETLPGGFCVGENYSGSSS